MQVNHTETLWNGAIYIYIYICTNSISLTCLTSYELETKVKEKTHKYWVLDVHFPILYNPFNQEKRRFHYKFLFLILLQEDEKAAAQVFEEFVASFQETGKHQKSWVKGGTVIPGAGSKFSLVFLYIQHNNRRFFLCLRH